MSKLVKPKVNRAFRNIRTRHWWLPTAITAKLATGGYEGWHLYWGPLHAWRVVTHYAPKAEPKLSFDWR